MRREGFRRLSHAVGTALAVFALALMFFLSKGFSEPDSGLYTGIGMAIFYVIGWGAVRLVAWVTEGFRQDPGK